jgi:hypothetical protein
MKNKLPPCFAFRNSGKHPRKDEIKKRFNEMAKNKSFNMTKCDADIFYGCNNNGIFDWHHYLEFFGSTVVEITEDDFLAMTEPELTELPKVFAFMNNPDSPNNELLIERFNSFTEHIKYDLVRNDYYGRHENGCVTFNYRLEDFGKGVIEITEQQFLDLTEPKPELTELPDNFYFQYVDEKDREVLKERFGRGSDFCCPNGYYGKLKGSSIFQSLRESSFEGATKITQADFIRLTEPEKKVEPEIVTESDFPYKGDIKDFPKEVVEWMLDNQVKQGSKRDISVFEKCRHDGNENGGFDWCIVDSQFCYDVIYKKNFATFFEKYPKYTSPEKTITGQIIEISERGILIELTREQIKEFKIFETVTIK